MNHPEAIVTAVAGKLQEVRSPHSEGRIVEENVLERVGVCETSEVETGEEVFARLPVLLFLHIISVEILSKVVEDVGGEVQGEHHADSLGLEVVGGLVRVSLVAGSWADVGDGEGHRVGGLQVAGQ